jgi:hypothetical protein
VNLDKSLEEIENFKSVQIWLKELRSRCKTEEIKMRLDLLRNFCVFVKKSPDELVNELYSKERTAAPAAFCTEALLGDLVSDKKILRRRDFYNKKINQFIEDLHGIPSVRDTYGNILEGFFVYNGIKMFRKPKVWFHTGRGSMHFRR